ncbi:MAG TPA: nuclear transport factor 2 family protein [Acidobacteriaceae bacterium]|jgi:hypothetical protein
MKSGVCSLVLVAAAVAASAQHPVQTKHYAIAGAPEGATGEYDSLRQLKVLDDFDQSHFLERFDHALLNNDRTALDGMISDRVIWVAERFGKGEDLDKEGVLASFGSKEKVKVSSHTRDHVLLRVFGDNTVMMTGNSTSILSYQKAASQSNRLFATVYMKIGGRWQCTMHTIMDYNGLLPGSHLAGSR